MDHSLVKSALYFPKKYFQEQLKKSMCFTMLNFMKKYQLVQSY
jgi:hypothetical protein